MSGEQNMPQTLSPLHFFQTFSDSMTHLTDAHLVYQLVLKPFYHCCCCWRVYWPLIQQKSTTNVLYYSPTDTRLWGLMSRTILKSKQFWYQHPLIVFVISRYKHPHSNMWGSHHVHMDAQLNLSVSRASDKWVKPLTYKHLSDYISHKPFHLLLQQNSYRIRFSEMKLMTHGVMKILTTVLTIWWLSHET